MGGGAEGLLPAGWGDEADDADDGADHRGHVDCRTGEQHARHADVARRLTAA
jgi:hypothetical protein